MYKLSHGVASAQGRVGRFFTGDWFCGGALRPDCASFFQVLKMKPVSIIIPAHNAAETIRTTLASLVTERAVIREVVLVDDGSTDGTAIAARQCAESLDLPLTVVESDCRDPGGARNVGLDAVDGDWIYFLDADDDHVEGGLRRLFEVASSEPGTDIVIGGYRRIVDGPDFTDKRPRKFTGDPVRNAGDYVAGLHRTVAVGSVLVRAGLIEQTRFPCGLHFDEDTVFWVQLFLRGRIATSPAVTMVYRLRTERAARRFMVDPHRRFDDWRTKLRSLGTKGLPELAIARREGMVALKIARVHYAAGDIETAHAFISLALARPHSLRNRVRVWRYAAKIAARKRGVTDSRRV